MKNVTLHSGVLRKLMLRLISGLALIFYTANAFAQNTEIIDLYDLQDKGIKVLNREVTYENSGNRKYLSLPRARKDGLIWLPVKEFQNGTIEIVMRGINEFQRSFIGIAFHGLDDSTYESVYCRPFNFLAEDSVRRNRAIQYVSHPVFTWEKLRTEQPAVFENEIINPPDPTDWFTMKIVIENKIVKAFINDSETPSLVLEKLGDMTSGKVGIFVADNSGGDFEKIKIEYR